MGVLLLLQHRHQHGGLAGEVTGTLKITFCEGAFRLAEEGPRIFESVSFPAGKVCLGNLGNSSADLILETDNLLAQGGLGAGVLAHLESWDFDGRIGFGFNCSLRRYRQVRARGTRGSFRRGFQGRRLLSGSDFLGLGRLGFLNHQGAGFHPRRGAGGTRCLRYINNPVSVLPLGAGTGEKNEGAKQNENRAFHGPAIVASAGGKALPWAGENVRRPALSRLTGGSAVS